jgi:arylsulfatase/arylsulfatase A
VEVIFKETYPAGNATITAGKARQNLDLVADQKRGHTTMMMLPAGKFNLSVEADFNGKSQGPHQVILKREPTAVRRRLPLPLRPL